MDSRVAAGEECRWIGGLAVDLHPTEPTSSLG
jgi:hypothetical protein